jgi:hypothetical protein
LIGANVNDVCDIVSLEKPAQPRHGGRSSLCSCAICLD